MSPAIATFLFELVNFLLLAALLGWLLFNPVRAALQARRDAEQLKAEELDARAREIERLRAELERRHAMFEAEMTEVRKARLAAAEREGATIVARAEEAAERERKAVRRTLAHVERAQLEQLSTAVATATRDSIRRLLALLDAPELEAALIQAACRQVRALDHGSLGAVLIESAQRPDAAEESLIRAALDDRAASAEFRVVPELGAGVRVTTTRGLVDASAAGIAKAAERFLTDALLTSSFETTP